MCPTSRQLLADCMLMSPPSRAVGRCDLNYVPNASQQLDAPKAAISDNLGFGGHNAALVFKAYEGEGTKK